MQERAADVQALAADVSDLYTIQMPTTRPRLRKMRVDSRQRQLVLLALHRLPERRLSQG